MRTLLVRESPAARFGSRRLLSEGFTLIETLIAVSIFGTIAATIYLSFSTGMEARAKVEDVSENLSRAGFALDVMAQDLRSPGRIMPGILEGREDGFRLAPGTASGAGTEDLSEAGTAAESVEYRLIEEPDGGSLLVRRLLRGEEVLSEIRLLSDVDSFEIAYFMSDLRGVGSWVGEWEPTEGLPYAVRVRMRNSTGEGSPAEYRRLIALPPSWFRPPIQSARSQAEEG